jgi:hypothetical protein
MLFYTINKNPDRKSFLEKFLPATEALAGDKTIDAVFASG